MADIKAGPFTIELSKLEVGNIAADGGMGDNLEQLGYIEQDSCSITIAEAEKTEFYAEEADDPVKVAKKAGASTFSFVIMNPSVETMAKLMGGTYTKKGEGSATETSYSFPDSVITIEQSIRITPKEGYIVEIARAEISVSGEQAFNRTNLGAKLNVTGTILSPTKAGTPKIKYKLIESE